MNYSQLDLKSTGVPLPYTTWVLLIHTRDMERFFHLPETCCGKQDSTWNGLKQKCSAFPYDLPQPMEITVCTRV